MATFLAIMIVGTLFFAASVFFGGDDHDFGHHDVDLDHGDVDFDHEHGGPGLLSIRNLMLFMVGFGAAGAIATHYGFSLAVASFFGALTGLAFAVLGLLLFRVLHQQQSNSLVSDRAFVSKAARVTVAIRPGELGQIVTQSDQGGDRYWSAQTTGTRKVIGVGEVVTIESIVGDTAIVATK